MRNSFYLRPCYFNDGGRRWKLLLWSIQKCPITPICTRTLRGFQCLASAPLRQIFGFDRLICQFKHRIQRRARVTPHTIFYQQEGGQKSAKKAVSKLLISFTFVLMVRSRRLELPLRLKNSDLNAARLPIPPRPHVVTEAPYPKPKAL